MIGNYPFWLRSTIDPSFSLSATDTVSQAYGLRVALLWWLLGITLTVGYFVIVYRSIRGKVPEVLPAVSEPRVNPEHLP